MNPVQQRLAAVPKALTEAIAAAGGEVLKCSVGRGRDADRWVADQIAHAEVDLDGRAKAMIIERIGEDRTRVIGLLETLAGVFGSGHEVGAADVAAISAVQADAADLDRVCGYAHRVEHGVRIQRIQAVGDVEVVTDVGIGVVGIAIPWIIVYVGLVQFTRVLTP